MKHLNKFIVLLATIIFMAVTVVFAEKTSVENLYQYTLDNGLTVFEVENHAVPLVYIEIAVRAGAKDQTPETAGLFHLYEHMMFKGNALYKDAAEVQHALSELGVTNWNGTTGIDCVNYFFTIPSDRIEDGLAFWNAAIRSPNMDRNEFENEKKVVLSEIEGDVSDPSHIYMNTMYSQLFPEAPYRLSPGGSTPVVKNATLDQLLDIKDKFYIPANSALFIGGDIDPEETFHLVEKIWGSWSNNGMAAPKPQAELSKNPFQKTTAIVMPYDQMSPQLASVSVSFRGPDTDFDLEDTYEADYFCQLNSDPQGKLVQSLYAKKDLMIPGIEYIGQSYATVRQSGQIQFAAQMLNPSENLPGRAFEMMDTIQKEIIPAMANDKSLYTKEKVQEIARYMEDMDSIVADTATGLLTNLRFWWIATSPEYYFSYNDKIASVTQSDMQKFFDKYIIGKNALISILVNPAVYEAHKDEYEKAGFIVADSETAAWWNDSKFAPDPKKIVKTNPKNQRTIDRSDIYRPEQAEKRESKKVSSITDGLKIVQLKNGIPVYIKKDASKKISTVDIATRGGLEHLTPETSGLEEALFNIMSSSSERYDFATRQVLQFQTQCSISSVCQEAGSMLSLNVLDSYFDTMLPVLVDGFLNPKYDEQVYSNMMNTYMDSVQTTLNNPLLLLAHTMTEEIYKGHPYEAQTDVTPESIQNITVANMENLHQIVLNPANIFVVAVGNIDEEKLVDMLNKNLGKIKITQLVRLPEKKIPEVNIKDGDPVILTHESATGTGYVVRTFNGPSCLSDEFIPASIAANIYSSIMFSIVRESHGVCYTPYSFASNSRAAFCGEELINLSNYEDFTFAMDNARQLMSLGMVVNGNNPGGSYSFDTIDKVLESYKNKFINSTYSTRATTESVAATIVSNLLYNDLTYSDKVVELIRNTSAEQIRNVFQKYWIDSPSRWFVIVGPNDKDKLIFKE